MQEMQDYDGGFPTPVQCMNKIDLDKGVTALSYSPLWLSVFHHFLLMFESSC